MEDHNILTAICAQCESNLMQIQISEEHGLAVGCAECNNVVLVIENGDHFDSQLTRMLNQGCAHKDDHRKEKLN